MAIIEEDQNEETTTSVRLSRRAFVGGAGALVVGFSLPKYIDPNDTLADTLPPVNVYNAPPPKPVNPVPPTNTGVKDGPTGAAVDTWVRVGSDNTVTILTGKCELGTGTATATLQIAADQLGVGMNQLKIINPDTWRTADQGTSSGSQTMLTQWNDGVRSACAAARAQLLKLGAAELGVQPSQLTIANGIVSVVGNPHVRVSFGELIGSQAFNVNITAKVQPVDPALSQVVGTSVPRIDIPDKVTAKFQFAHDVKVPGMLHGRVVRPPTLDSTLVGVDTTPNGPGVVAIVVKGNFIGVVAETEWEAIQAAEKLKPQWNVNPLPDMGSLYDTLKAQTPTSISTLFNGGAVAEAISQSPMQLSSEYHWPYQIHAPIGPPVAVADVHPGGATIWSGTQGPYPLSGTIASVLKLPASSVRVIFMESSGCYGIDGDDNCALDAVLMSQAVGSPVRVQYMRADEHGWENYGQAMVMQASAGFDNQGNIQAWQYNTYTASRGNRPSAGTAYNVPTGQLIGLMPPAPKAATTNALTETPTGPDGSNTATGYNIPRSLVVSNSVGSRFFTGPMRSPNRLQNTFANESFMDEIAAAAGVGPLALRLKYIADPRLAAVFQRVAADAKWNDAVRHTGKHGSGHLKTGFGMAGMRYEGTGAYAAVIVNLTVDTKTGDITVNKVWGAQDCGICLNPDGMRNQAEGCVIQGISRTLHEAMTWNAKGIKTIDWYTYPILRFEKMPQSFHLSIISNPENPVLGAGEVVITAMPAAIGNAVFDATGARMREVPFTPARVKAALKAV
ncbi:MAG: molybdopterin-dependent oxidoreductase [Conexibacteraceae bacterium]|nr:molybdopterin-dependent oxidoreductase [Conexibacteraceae bacterium]